ncbi:fibronectin type III domain-containing protein [Streptomyces sp. NPDC047108]|uniref:fibronectin type III domain-containing protein n=1 Tax=Streptomyces sp. NPDC047108 TaxID=3155025 RepID=UPI0033ED4B77
MRRPTAPGSSSIPLRCRSRGGRVPVLCLLLGSLTVTACGALGPGGGDGQAPSAPAGVTVHTGSATSVHVMWTRSTDDTGVARYEVYEGGEMVAKVPGGRYMVDVTGLKPGARLAFTVRARDASGNLSSAGREIRVTLPSAAAADDRTAPTRPGRLRGRADGGRAATLTWAASQDTLGVASYDIHQGGVRIHTVDGGDTTALLTGLRPGTRYTFTVRARDAAGNVSPAAHPVRVTTAHGPGAGTGTAPTGFRVHARTTASGAHTLVLSWLPPRTGGDVPAYEIHLDGAFATTLTWGAAPPRGTVRHSLAVGKEPGATYRVKVRARLPDGTWGRFTPERTVTTPGSRTTPSSREL